MSKECSVDYGFIVHPMNMDDVAKRYVITLRMARQKTAKRVVMELLRHHPPFVASHIAGVRSQDDGREVVGALAVVPLLPEHFEELKDEVLVDKVVGACKACARQGARIVGLGAMTAFPGRGGRAVAEQMQVAVTTGNTYTVSAAIQATRQAARAMGIDPKGSTLTVVGATTPMGRACSILLADDFGRLLLADRGRARLGVLVHEVKGSRGTDVSARTDLIAAVREAEVVVLAGASPAATSPTEAMRGASTTELIRPEDLRPGSIVCDVSRPRELSRELPMARPDVLAIHGGLVRVPGRVRYGLDLGLPPGTTLACVAETMLLALERRFEDYTLGREVAVPRVLELDEMAAKHGFAVAGLRWGQGALAPDAVERVKAMASPAPS